MIKYVMQKLEIMKKIYLNIMLVSIVTMGVVGCSSDNLLVNDSKLVKVDDVVASVEGHSSTRIAMVDAVPKSLVWTSGDQISVFDETGASGTLGLNEDYANQAMGKFGGNLDANFGTMVSAAYPSEGTSLSDETLTMSIPAEISLADAVMVKGNKVYKFPLPMFGKFDDNNIEFKFLTGMLKLAIGNLPAKTEKVIITADKQISGTFTASTGDDEPILGPTTTAESDKKVTVTFNALTESSNKVIYIPLPAQDYGNVTVQYAGKFDGSNMEIRNLVSWDSKAVERRMVYTAAYGVSVEVNATSPSEVSASIGNIIQSAEVGIPINITLTGVVTTSSSNKDITVPTQNATGEAIDVNLIFNKIPSDADGTLGIKTDQTGSETTIATNKLTVSFPEIPESDPGINLNIDAPTSTVTLKSTSESATKYKEVVARTAYNTLIVDDDITVNNTDIHDGTVQINTGAILESWTFAPKYEEEKVIIRENGFIEPIKIYVPDESGNYHEQYQITKEDGDAYLAKSLKVVKSDAGRAPIFFLVTDPTKIPLKTVTIGDGAVLQTNWISIQSIEGLGTAKIQFLWDFNDTYILNFCDEPYPGNSEIQKWYQHQCDMYNLDSLKNVTICEPVFTYWPSIEEQITQKESEGYVQCPPMLTMAINKLVENCTINFDYIHFCPNKDFPLIKDCNFVPTGKFTDCKNRIEISAAFLENYNQNSTYCMRFKDCNFGSNTIIKAQFGTNSPSAIDFTNCSYNEQSLDNLELLNQIINGQFIIKIGGEDKYRADYDSNGNTVVTQIGN